MPTTLRNTDILFNDLTTQSTAFTGFPTTYGAVGTYVVAGYSLSGNSGLAIGTTVAGSTLLRAADVGGGSENFVAMNLSAIGAQLYPYFIGTTNLGLSGTWRCMTRILSGSGSPLVVAGLFVRVS